MDNNELPPENIEQMEHYSWVEQRARPDVGSAVDPELLKLSIQQELLWNKLAETRGSDLEAREALRQLGQDVLDRYQELGIDPLNHPEVNPPPPSSQE